MATVLGGQQELEIQALGQEEENEKERVHEEQEKEAGEAANSGMVKQKREEVLNLQARGAELEKRLALARTGLASARERREFMEEETEQAREYGKKLAQEMSRLARIAQGLPPDQITSLEKLQRLVKTHTEAKAEEEKLIKEGRAQEAALRAEIDDFTGDGSSGGGDIAGATARDHQEYLASTVNAEKEESFLEKGRGAGSLRTGKAIVAGLGGGERSEGKRRGGGTVVLQKSVVDDPLAALMLNSSPPEYEERGDGPTAVGGGRDENGRNSSVVGMKQGSYEGGGSSGSIKSKPKKKKAPRLEGRALLAEGLHRIEAAYDAAAAEREVTASRLSRLRLAVARRQREEDASPGHAELLQYLLRFEELGRHALEREEQLRRCQAELSTLSLTMEFLANEARLMESIAVGVEDASKGGKGPREVYMRQLEGIVQEVQDLLTNQTRLLNVVRGRRLSAEETRESAKEDRKRFLAGSKELADECYRYESLTAHLTLMGR